MSVFKNITAGLFKIFRISNFEFRHSNVNPRRGFTHTPTFDSPRRGRSTKSRKLVSGFTLIEAVIYGAILAMVMVIVVGGLLRLGTAYVKIQNTRKVNEAGSFVLDRFSREMRRVTEDGFTVDEDADSITFETYGTFAELVRKDGAVSHWDFEETSGTTLVDRIGENDGVFQNFNANANEVAEVGRGIIFDGIDDYIEITTSSDPNEIPNDVFNAHSEGAIEAIFRTNGVGAADYPDIFSLLGTDIYGRKSIVKLSLNVEERPVVFAIDDGVNNPAFWTWELAHAGNSLGTTNFTHVVLQTSESENETVMYINGSKQSLETIGLPTSESPSSFSNWFFNKWKYAGTNYWIGNIDVEEIDTNFSGVLDELVIYDRPLSADKIAAHYSEAFGTSTEDEDIEEEKKITRSIEVQNGSLVLVSDSDGQQSITETFIGVNSEVVIDTFEVYEINDGEAVRIQIAVRAGSGEAAVERTFTQTISRRAVSAE